MLKTAQQWTKGALARALKGGERVLDPCSKKAQCWCLLGALHKCYPDPIKYELAEVKLRDFLEARYGHRGITRFNDAEGRKFSTVRKLLEETGV